ncbi:MAG TPA: helix-turn-helix domain-containing protein [Terriglobales bacterium]|nr:helix-turn-helix domain-containing protein [Terriglobales bacterium]
MQETVSTAEAATIRGVSLVVIYREIATKKLTAIRADGKWRIPMEALNRRIEQVAEWKRLAGNR